MAKADFSVVETSTKNNPTRSFSVQAGATPILVGEPVIVDGGNPGYVIAAPDGAGSTSSFAGLVAASDSTQTASADGIVTVYDDPEIIVRGKATTPANLPVANKLTKVTIDLTGGVYTFDEDDTVNGVATIVDFDTTAGTVDVRLARSARYDN